MQIRPDAATRKPSATPDPSERDVRPEAGVADFLSFIDEAMSPSMTPGGSEWTPHDEPEFEENARDDEPASGPVVTEGGGPRVTDSPDSGRKASSDAGDDPSDASEDRGAGAAAEEGEADSARSRAGGAAEVQAQALGFAPGGAVDTSTSAAGAPSEARASMSADDAAADLEEDFVGDDFDFADFADADSESTGDGEGPGGELSRGDTPPPSFADLGAMGAADAASRSTASAGPGDALSVDAALRREATAPTAPAPPASTARGNFRAVEVDRVIEQIKLQTRPGVSRIQLVVDPPELGRLAIRLALRGDHLVGQIAVESAELLQQLREQLPALREAMGEAGVDVQDFEFTQEESIGGRDEDAASDADAETEAESQDSAKAGAQRARLYVESGRGAARLALGLNDVRDGVDVVV